MKNITLAVDEDVLDRVRVASEQDRRAEARRGLRELMEKSQARLGPDYKWNREEIYEDRMFPRHQRSDLRGDGET